MQISRDLRFAPRRCEMIITRPEPDIFGLFRENPPYLEGTVTHSVDAKNKR